MNLLMSVDLFTIGSIGLFCLVALIMVGVPVAIAIFAVGFIGQALLFDFWRAADQLYQAVFAKSSDQLLASIPLFLLMGQLVAASTIARDLYEGIYNWLGRLPGGLAITSIVSGAGFGAVTGVSAAAVATMSTIALPQMKRYHYDLGLASGSITSSSALAVLIPPSVLMIVYGIATESSIGALFLAGIVPGIFLTLAFSAYVFLIAVRFPEKAPRGERFPLHERLAALNTLFPFLRYSRSSSAASI